MLFFTEKGLFEFELKFYDGNRWESIMDVVFQNEEDLHFENHMSYEDAKMRVDWWESEVVDKANAGEEQDFLTPIKDNEAYDIIWRRFE